MDEKEYHEKVNLLWKRAEGRKKMTRKIIIGILLILFVYGLLNIGCAMNPAADRFAKRVYQHKEKIIETNPKLSAGEKLIIVVTCMQACGFTDDEILKYKDLKLKEAKAAEKKKFDEAMQTKPQTKGK